MPSTLFLCFRADGPYWKDLVYVPAYPAGFSYAKWAFRYDANGLISSSVAAECRNNKETILHRDAILGARFISAKKDQILPLRKIQINWIQVIGGITQLYFRVQSLRNFKEQASLEDACLTIPPAEFGDPTEVGEMLAFHSDVDVSKLSWSNADDEDESWSKLLKLISSTTLPLDTKVKTATYFRLSHVLDQGKPVLPEVLESSPGKGPVYGPKLKEGKTYQIRLTHHIGGTHTGTAPILPITMDLPSDHVQLTEPAVEVLGWYQITPIVFEAVQRSNSVEVLLVRSGNPRSPQPEKDAEKNPKNAAEETDADTIVYLPIPMRVTMGWWYRLRTNWILKIGLALALTIQASIAYLKDFIDKLIEGKGSLADLRHYGAIFLLLFVFGAIAAILVKQMGGSPNSKD